MGNKIINTNEVTLTGEIISGFKFNHKIGNTKFYSVLLAVDRISGNIDRIILMIPETLINVNCDYIGKYIHVTGKLTSYNKIEDNKSKLKISVSVKTIEFINEDELSNDSNNKVILDGYICKPTECRKTPKTNRDVADIMLAVNRVKYGVDYIPCICWGYGARSADTFDVGTRIKITGRIQSRDYIKKLSDTESDIRTAYEVSISELKVI